MLGIFSGTVISAPDELATAGERTPSPKMTASKLADRFIDNAIGVVSVKVDDSAQFAYTHHNECPSLPRSFAVKDEIFCLFEGCLDNLGSLRNQYGLSKTANEAVLVMEAYKTLRDRAPFPASHVVGHLLGNFSFIVYDKSTSALFVATDQEGRVPLFWGITADGYVAFADNLEFLKGACGKSLASFPQGCFFSTALGELKCYENPKNKVIAIPAPEEEIWGTTFKVEQVALFAGTK